MFIVVYLLLQLVIGVIIENIEMQKSIEDAAISQTAIQVRRQADGIMIPLPDRDPGT